MKKRNRIISLILCGVLILSLVPQTVFGAEVAGAGSSEDNGQNLVLQSEEECICETLCAEDSINTECPVCSVEGADFSKCQGAADQTEDVPDPAVTAVQEQMDALPTVEEVTGMDQEQQMTVKEQVQAVQDAYNALTQEQKEKVTGAEILEELLDALENGTGAAEVVDSGTFGEGSWSWSLDSEGVLIIRGEGEMPSNGSWSNKMPWQEYSENVVEVILSDNIVSIANSAFSDFSTLKSVVFPESIKTIGDCAFSGCSNLTLTKLPDGITYIGEEALAKCEKLTLTKLPNSLKEIGDKAFISCSNLSLDSLPDSLQTIGSYAFMGCDKIATLTIPEGVTYLESDALFSNSLQEIYFNGIIAPTLGGNAFPWGATIYVPEGATGYTDKNNWPEEQIAHSITIQNDGNGTAEANVAAAKYEAEITLTAKPNKGYRFEKWEVISGDITISDNKFSMPMGKVVVKAIFQPSPVPGEIAYGTFGEDDCLSWSLDENGVLTVTGVEDMPECEWNSDSGYYLVDDGTLWEIPWDMYRDQITEVVVNGGITSIPYAFYDCNKLKKVKLSDRIVALGGGAFSGCTNLETINLPDTITYIGNSTFANCSNLMLTELPNNLQYLGDGFGRTFENCTKLSLTSLPDTITYIDEYTFSGCTNLALTELPNGIGSIAREAFKGCTNLALTRLPARVAWISEYAFQDCTNLTMMKLPGNLESIAEGTFAGCSNLSFVELPDGLRYIEESAFEGCSKLSTLEMPDSLLLIGQNSFRGCDSLTSLELPKNLDSIEAGAFDGCTNLEELTFGGKVAPLLAENEFDDCENLTIYIPSGAVGYTEENNWPEELIAHPITVQNDGNGTASASRTAAKAGTEIILIAKPDDGYQFDQWEVVSGGVTIEDDTFTMPMGDVTVKARFEKAPDQGQEPEKDRYYTLHFDTNGGSSLGFVYEKEDTVVSLLHYIPVRAGYQFTGWYEDVELTKKIASVRLDENMIVYAGWEKIETDTREEQKISMMNALQVRDLKNGSRTTSSKVCTLKLGFAADDPDLELTYTTSDPSVATVKDGKITYQGVGECTITVTAEETETCKAASLSITVKVGALGTPTFTPSVTAKTAKKAFTVTSNTVRGVDGYEVQYSIRKDFWKPVTKDFSDTGAKLYRKTCPTMQSNRTYYIHVRGYQVIDGEKVYSDWSPVKTIKTK